MFELCSCKRQFLLVFTLKTNTASYDNLKQFVIIIVKEPFALTKTFHSKIVLCFRWDH